MDEEEDADELEDDEDVDDEEDNKDGDWAGGASLGSELDFDVSKTAEFCKTIEFEEGLDSEESDFGRSFVSTVDGGIVLLTSDDEKDGIKGDDCALDDELLLLSFHLFFFLCEDDEGELESPGSDGWPEGTMNGLASFGVDAWDCAGIDDEDGAGIGTFNEGVMCGAADG